MKWVFFMFLLVLGMGFFAYRGCASDAEKTLGFAKSLLAKTDDYEQARKASAQALADTSGEFSKMTNTTSGENATLFEKQWIRVHNRYDALRARYSNLGVAIDAYFAELDRVTLLINDNALRAQQEQKNTELRKQTRQKFEVASEQMDRLTKTLKQGDDAQHILALEAARRAVSTRLDDVRGVVESAKQVCADLEAITRQGYLVAGISAIEPKS